MTTILNYFLLLSVTVSSVCLSAQNPDSSNPMDSITLHEAIDNIAIRADSLKQEELAYVHTLLQSALMLSDTSTYYDFSLHIARHHFYNKELFDEGILFLRACKSRIGNGMNRHGDFENSLGIFHKKNNYYSESLEHFFASVNWYEKYEPLYATAPLGNLSEMYFLNKEYDKALKYNLQALGYTQQLEEGDEKLNYLTIDYFRIGEIFSAQENYEEADHYFNKSIDIARNIGDSGAMLVYAITQALPTYIDTKNYKRCRQLIAEADAICAGDDGQCNYVMNYQLQKSRFYLHSGQAQNARHPEDFAKKNVSINDEINAYAVEYYGAMGDSTAQIKSYQKIIALNEDQAIKDRINAFSSIEKNYLNRKLQEENLQLSEKNLSASRANIIISVILLMLLMLFISQYLHNRRVKKLNGLLEERSEELESTHSELAKSYEELERFNFSAAHDLKTPLRMIVNYTQLAERRLTSDQDRPADNTTMEYLSYVREGGVRLHYLISDIMDYTSIERVDCYNQNRPLDLNDIIRDIELSLRDDKENKGEISISNEKLPAIESHYNSLYVILQNVIENGIKYNESEQPEIIITSGEDQDFHYIYVSDNGIGIEEAYQEKVFDMFYRLHNNNVYKGTGLGLAIAKKTIEKMRGDISISSQLNQGTRVTIKLPRKPCEKSLKKLSQAATAMA